MRESTKVHLEGITKESLMQFKKDHFTRMAYITGRMGTIEIGVTIDGYGVKDKGRFDNFDNAEDAIKYYKDCIDEYNY
jgi:hypothetical protein